MLKIGCAKADITPPVGVSLSGFAVRKDRPSVAVDDPLQVKALAIEFGGSALILLSYDLLGLDARLDSQVRSALQVALGERIAPQNILLTMTHTHSGPPTMPIAGETRAPEEYIQKILQATVGVASCALGSLAAVELLHASATLEGINHNRRERHVPGAAPGQFPLDKTLDLFLFRTPDGECKSGLIRFSCHAVTMLTQHLSADYPGELTARLERQYGAPILFLEGTAGDSNPTTHGADHAAMLGFVDAIMEQLGGISASLRPVAAGQARLASREFAIPLAPFPPRDEIVERISRNERILGGDFSVPDLQPLVAEYAGWRSADDPDLPGTVRHWAEVYRASALHTLEAAGAPQAFSSVPFRAAALELGEFLFVFLSGEILTRVGMHIQALAPEKTVKVISYLSPVAGYIADPLEYDRGGYELENAWMWYRMPGPFHREVESVLLKQVSDMIDGLSEEENT